MNVVINGENQKLPDGATVDGVIERLRLTGKRLAVEVNNEIVPKSRYAEHALHDGDRVEIVHAIGGGAAGEDLLRIGKYTFHSRLLVGTGKYKDLDETRAAILASGAEIVTVAIRRTNIGQHAGEPNLLDVIPPDQFTILPNTAGCYTADDALRTCRMARELLDGHTLVKLEVLGDQKTLYPDIVQTLSAAEQLVREGFEVMVYTSDDPLIAKQLENIGCVAVMPLAAPIGSGLGVQNKYNILTIIENAKVPIIVDAGVGTASDATIAMELGCDGVLMNTAIAAAQKPVLMAEAMKKGVEAGRAAFLAGRMPRRRYASASSPIDGSFF
jgi:thiazole synthase